MTIRAAQPGDEAELEAMIRALWPDADDAPALAAGCARGTQGAPTWIAFAPDGEAVGFLYMSIRSHAEDCYEGPVPYIEGWWVAEPMRRRGVARALLAAAEAWCRAQGHYAIASDTEVENTASQLMHQALGFELGRAIVPMKKDLRAGARSGDPEGPARRE